ncbi:hypothetical protein EBZ38_00150 [bacterium]|nr:hypothetical protein [bacterium]
MSEEKKKLTVEVYKEGTTIDVKIPVEYVYRFNQLLLEFIPFTDQNHFNTVMKNITDGKIEGPFEYHVSTVLMFLNLIEDSARAQDLLKTVEYDPETQTKKDISEG